MIATSNIEGFLTCAVFLGLTIALAAVVYFVLMWWITR